MQSVYEKEYMSVTKAERSRLTLSLSDSAFSAGPEIGKVLEYVNEPRKYLCAMMAIGAYRAAGGRDTEAELDVSYFTEAVNLSWMVLDDTVDGHTIRFAKPAARIIFGDAAALISATHLLSDAYTRMSKYHCLSLGKLNRTYEGWLKRDVVTGKSLIQCKQTLQALGSSYGAFMRIAAEVAGAGESIMDNIEFVGLEMGFSATLLGEFLDLSGGIVGRQAREELRQGNDIYLVKAAEEEGVTVRDTSEAWETLKETRAFSNIREKILYCLADCETRLLELPGPTNLILASISLLRGNFLTL